MKEFRTQTGGRFVYSDDILNLQDLSLAYSSLFAGCGNFVISGCEVVGTKILEGYVFINGKVRKFAETTVANFPQYIYELNHTEEVAYEDGPHKIGREAYNCAIAASAPTQPDVITGNPPQYIEITEDGGRRVKDALFGKYGLLLDAGGEEQIVADPVKFLKKVTMTGGADMETGTLQFNVRNGDPAYVGCTDNGLRFKQTNQIGMSSEITLSANKVGVRFNSSSNTAEFNSSGINVNGAVNASALHTSQIAITSNSIYSATNGYGGIFVNNGYGHGQAPAYKDFTICDGNANWLFRTVGQSGLVEISGKQKNNSTKRDVLALNMTDAMGGEGQVVSFQKQGTESAYIGYNDASRNVFAIKSDNGIKADVGAGVFDVTGSIKEDGELLTEKYVQLSAYNSNNESVMNTLNAKLNTADLSPVSISNLPTWLTSMDVTAQQQKDIRDKIGVEEKPKEAFANNDTSVFSYAAPSGGNVYQYRFGNMVRLVFHGVGTGRVSKSGDIMFSGPEGNFTIPFPEIKGGNYKYNNEFYVYGRGSADMAHVIIRKNQQNNAIEALLYYNGEKPDEISFDAIYFI